MFHLEVAAMLEEPLLRGDVESQRVALDGSLPFLVGTLPPLAIVFRQVVHATCSSCSAMSGISRDRAVTSSASGAGCHEDPVLVLRV